MLTPYTYHHHTPILHWPCTSTCTMWWIWRMQRRWLSNNTTLLSLHCTAGNGYERSNRSNSNFKLDKQYIPTFSPRAEKTLWSLSSGWAHNPLLKRWPHCHSPPSARTPSHTRHRESSLSGWQSHSIMFLHCTAGIQKGFHAGGQGETLTHVCTDPIHLTTHSFCATVFGSRRGGR